VQVLSFPRTPKWLWVRWPGGKEMTVPIPPNAREIQVDFGGTSRSG
jgi:hypothetical protein